MVGENDSLGAAQAGTGGGSVDDNMKQLMKELGGAINESLSESEQIAEVISRIKAGGYDVFLVLEATIGFNRSDDKENSKSASTHEKTEVEFKINAQDQKFLKSLKISVDG